MEQKLMIRSKVLKQPRKSRRIFIVLLRISVVFLILSSIIGFFVSGFQFSKLLGIFLPAMVLDRFMSMVGSKPYFEHVLAEILFSDSEMNIKYQALEKRRTTDVQVPYEQISKVEYSRQQSCYKLTFDSEISGTSNGTYHLLYMEPASCIAFSSALRQKTGLPIIDTEKEENGWPA